MARPKKDPNIKRKEFIDKATILFFEKGYDNTSINDILTAAGKGSYLSPSVFYYYFKSKDEIFEAVLQEYMDIYIAQIIKILEDSRLTFTKKMQEAMKIYIKAIDDFKKVDTYFDQAAPRNAYVNYVIDKQGMASLVEPLDRLLQEGIMSGYISQTTLLKQAGTKIMAQIFLSSILPLTHQGRESDGQHHSEKYAHLVPQIFAQIFNVQAILEEE